MQNCGPFWGKNPPTNSSLPFRLRALSLPCPGSRTPLNPFRAHPNRKKNDQWSKFGELLVTSMPLSPQESVVASDCHRSYRPEYTLSQVLLFFVPNSKEQTQTQALELNTSHLLLFQKRRERWEVPAWRGCPETSHL